MGQERLAALSRLCIESDVLRQLHCTELIDNFAHLKCGEGICKDRVSAFVVCSASQKLHFI